MRKSHVVITGASSGIGKALAEVFAEAPFRLSLVARRRTLLEELCAALPVEAQPIEADLSQPGSSTDWLRRAEASFGPTDILINNAGVSYVEPTVGVDAERVRILFQVNLHTPIAATHAVLEPMLSRSSGTIVNVVSNAAFTPAPWFSHYTASKGALGNFSESLRMELAGTGVDVVTVYPGPIETPMGDRNWDQLEASAFARLASVGDTATLAAKVRDAVERRRARVIYPAAYALAWWLPGVGRFITNRFMPRARGNKTPPLPGDLEH